MKFIPAVVMACLLSIVMKYGCRMRNAIDDTRMAEKTLASLFLMGCTYLVTILSGLIFKNFREFYSFNDRLLFVLIWGIPSGVSIYINMNKEISDNGDSPTELPNQDK